MSDDDSFIILESCSPSRSISSLYSLTDDVDYIDCYIPRSSKVEDLANAPNVDETQAELQTSINSIRMKGSNHINESLAKTSSTEKLYTKEHDIDNSVSISREPQPQTEANVYQAICQDYCVERPLVQDYEQKANETNKKMSSSLLNGEGTSQKQTPILSADKNLAASFLMGEISSDELKSSVYSQFPNISMGASAEDVIKLQSMVTDYKELKDTIKKANNTMKLFYNNSMQWKDKMNTMEEQHKQQLEHCQKEIEELREENRGMENNFKLQIEALEIARKKDHEENVREISEKNALLENMRAQVIKVEKQLGSLKLSLQDQNPEQTLHFGKMKMTRSEHEFENKELQRQLSELLAANWDLKDLEHNYIHELNYLKVNLTSAEELIKKNRHDILQLTAENAEKQERIETLEMSIKSLQHAYEEQKEHIILLETQNEVHRKDFEIEKQSRDTTVKEKQQLLQDLRLLQDRNQKLIEEYQKMSDIYHQRLSAGAAGGKGSQTIAASASAQTYHDNPQRPIRMLPPPFSNRPQVYNMCPVCNKNFSSLNILLSHVNDCVDKN